MVHHPFKKGGGLAGLFARDLGGQRVQLADHRRQPFAHRVPVIDGGCDVGQHLAQLVGQLLAHANIGAMVNLGQHQGDALAGLVAAQILHRQQPAITATAQAHRRM